MIKRKKYLRYLDYQIQNLSSISEHIYNTLSRLETQDYKDIREMFAGVENIVDLSKDKCRPDEVTVEYTFGTIERSPIDGFSLKDIGELLKFCEMKIRKLEGMKKQVLKEKDGYKK